MTTVGRVAVDPNGPAIIPRAVTFTVDGRHPDPAKREGTVDCTVWLTLRSILLDSTLYGNIPVLGSKHT